MNAFIFVQGHLDRGYISCYVECFRTLAVQEAGSLLSLLAEPVARPALMHEYNITPFSLGVAVTSGIKVSDVLAFLNRYVYGFASNHPSLSPNARKTICEFIRSCMEQYHLASVVVDESRIWIHCASQQLALQLLADPVIRSLAASPIQVHVDDHEKHLSLSKAEGLPSEVEAYLNRGRPLENDESTPGDLHRHPMENVSAPSACARFELQDRAMAKFLCERSVELGVPITQTYNFEGDHTLRTVNIALKTHARPRPYQVDAVRSCAGKGLLRSGVLVLPCGAGKTLLGIMVCCAVRKPTLIVCASSISVEQWKNQILEFASLLPPEGQNTSESVASKAAHVPARPMRISCLTAKQKDEITNDTDIVITTYSMLVVAHKSHVRQMAHQSATALVALSHIGESSSLTSNWRPKKRVQDSKAELFRPWGLLLLDEVHVIPADVFRESISYIDAKGVIGLTATCVREDRRIGSLFHLVGPKLFDASWESLAAQGYLATVTCVEVHVPMTNEFGQEHMDRSRANARCGESAPMNDSRISRKRQRCTRPGGAQLLALLAASNPNKMLCVLQLVRRHLEESAKVLVFCDHIVLLKEYGKLLDAPVVCGETGHKERLMVFSDFQATSKVNVVCVSRVGDVSVNLPSANVVIQVSSHGGSRRQEAQRLGRILRPKEKAANGASAHAWFYTIVSKDTHEVAYAAHRTSFLVDQGYSCRLMEYQVPSFTTRLHEPEERPAELKTKTHRTTKCGTFHAPAQMTDRSEGSNCDYQLNEIPHQSRIVGDTVSVKQEVLRQAMLSSRVLRHATSISNDSIVLQREWQLQLLARIVSTWELEYRNSDIHRDSRTSAISGSRTITGQETDSALSQARTTQMTGNKSSRSSNTVQTYSTIKNEWIESNHVHSAQLTIMPGHVERTMDKKPSAQQKTGALGRNGGQIDQRERRERYHPGTCHPLTLQEAACGGNDLVYHEI